LPPRPTDKRPTFKCGAYDSELNVTVAWIMGVRRPGGTGWLIDANGEFVAFELTTYFSAQINGEDCRAITFYRFGDSPSLGLRVGVRGRTLDDSIETRALQLLAIEGVLVAYKRIVTRYWAPPVFMAFDREWRLTNFGHTEEADLDDA